MADFLISYAPLKEFEGGWCNVRGDAGGETYAGIARNFFPDWPGWPVIDAEKSHASFRQGAAAFSRHIALLPGLRDMVTDWYRVEWWDRMRLGQFPQIVADELFEQAVNLGRGGSGRYVQRLCNSLNRRKGPRGEERIFADLAEDGCLGPKSLTAMATLLAGRVTAAVFVHALNGLQLAHYVGLGSKSFDKRKFMDGWLTRTYCPTETH